MNRRRFTLFSWTVVTAVLGAMISLQYHDVVLGGAAIWSAFPDVSSVGNRLQAVSRLNDQLRHSIRATEQLTYSLQKQELHQGGTMAQLEKQIHAAIVLTGLSPLVGPGVVITIDDGRMSPVDQEQFLTHDWDLRSVVNELFLAGADAVSINQARITAQTGVFCIGPVVRVGGIRLGPPFVVRAIGDPSVLSAALSFPGSVLDALRGENRGLYVSQPRKLSKIHLPAFSAPLAVLQGGTAR